MALALSNVTTQTAAALPSGRRSRQTYSNDTRPAALPMLHSNCFPSGRMSGRSSRVRPVATAAANKGRDGMVPVGHQPREAPTPYRRQRSETPSVLLDSWDPFSAGSLRQMMDTIDHLFDVTTTPTGSRRGVRTPWDAIEDEEGFYIRVDMPGFDKEDVKVLVEGGVLVIKGERQPQGKEEERWASKTYSKFNTRLALPDNVELDKIKAELKNGVLSVTVPKPKPENRKQVIDVQIL